MWVRPDRAILFKGDGYALNSFEIFYNILVYILKLKWVTHSKEHRDKIITVNNNWAKYCNWW